MNERGERIVGEIVGKWTVPAMGGDEPGMVTDELPLLGQEIIEQTQHDYDLGLIPDGKRILIAKHGPITRPDGKRVIVIYKIEYPPEE